jgi:hypothetical protein
MRSLTYIGPPIMQLHQEYAKQGRINERAMVTTTCEVVIKCPSSAGLGNDCQSRRMAGFLSGHP